MTTLFQGRASFGSPFFSARAELNGEYGEGYGKGNYPKICPYCAAKIEHLGALSRRDNETEICSSCGTDEFLDGYQRRGEIR